MCVQNYLIFYLEVIPPFSFFIALYMTEMGRLDKNEAISVAEWNWGLPSKFGTEEQTNSCRLHHVCQFHCLSVSLQGSHHCSGFLTKLLPKKAGKELQQDVESV